MWLFYSEVTSWMQSCFAASSFLSAHELPAHSRSRPTLKCLFVSCCVLNCPAARRAYSNVGHNHVIFLIEYEMWNKMGFYPHFHGNCSLCCCLCRTFLPAFVIFGYNTWIVIQSGVLGALKGGPWQKFKFSNLIIMVSSFFYLPD